MKKFIATGSCVLLVAGCVTVQPVNWVRAWPGTNEAYKERAQCDYETTAAVQLAQPGIGRGAGVIGQAIVEGIDIGVRRADLFVRCMHAKGWRRGAPGEVGASTVSATAGTATESLQVASGAPTQFAAAQAPKVQTKWLMQAENAAKADWCAKNPLATLTVSGSGFETYAVPCANGDTMIVRCEVSGCRQLK